MEAREERSDSELLKEDIIEISDDPAVIFILQQKQTDYQENAVAGKFKSNSALFKEEYKGRILKKLLEEKRLERRSCAESIRMEISTAKTEFEGIVGVTNSPFYVFQDQAFALAYGEAKEEVASIVGSKPKIEDIPPFQFIRADQAIALTPNPKSRIELERMMLRLTLDKDKTEPEKEKVRQYKLSILRELGLFSKGKVTYMEIADILEKESDFSKSDFSPEDFNQAWREIVDEMVPPPPAQQRWTTIVETLAVDEVIELPNITFSPDMEIKIRLLETWKRLRGIKERTKLQEYQFAILWILLTKHSVQTSLIATQMGINPDGEDMKDFRKACNFVIAQNENLN